MWNPFYSPYLKKVLVLCVLVSFNTGCSRGFIPLNDELASEMGSIEAISIIVHDQAEPMANTSTAGAAGAGFGLIGGIIAAGIISGQLESARKKISGIEAEMEGFDFRSQVRERLREEFDRSNKIKISDLSGQDKSLSKKDRLRIVKENEGDGVLFLSTGYFLSPDHRVITLRMIPEIWSKKAGKPVYTGRFQAFSRALETKGDSAFAEWGEEGGKRYREAVEKGINEVAGFLRMELLEPKGDDRLNEEFHAAINHPLTGAPVFLKGTLVKKDEDLLWVRSKSEGLVSIHCDIIRPARDIRKSIHGKTKAKSSGKTPSDEEREKLTHC